MSSEAFAMSGGLPHLSFLQGPVFMLLAQQSRSCGTGGMASSEIEGRV